MCKNINIVDMKKCQHVDNSCFCSDEPHPLCGVDGKRYTNSCHLRCAEVTADASLDCFNEDTDTPLTVNYSRERFYLPELFPTW